MLKSPSFVITFACFFLIFGLVSAKTKTYCQSSSDCNRRQYCSSGICVPLGSCDSVIDCLNPKNKVTGNCKGGVGFPICKDYQKCKVDCSSACPDGSDPVECFADPCSVTKCADDPDAICISNYCGGCNAIFINAAGEQVCNPATTCPEGMFITKCRNPCEVQTCPEDPNAICIPNNCGGCNALFFNEAGQQICVRDNGGTIGDLPPFGCPPDSPKVECLVDPCQNAKCPEDPSAVCVANYCGGCNAVFFNAVDEAVCTIKGTATDETPSSECPDGSPGVRCFADPCQGATCPDDPKATCVANYCGGCNALFYNSAGKQVCVNKTRNLRATV